MYTFISLFISFLCVVATILVIYLFLKKRYLKTINTLIAEKEHAENSLNELKASLTSPQDKEQAEIEKKKMEEKNRKLWVMSETVHKERKKVDEQNEQLLVEKEKLEADKKKLDEKVKKLWSQSTAIHKEKERINTLKIEIEHKHQEIIDSVNYAKRIQEAILPDKQEINECLPQSFILFQPRDIVSGDFYWFSYKNGKNILAAVDCTGHGVPGAFMSMIGNTLLNEIVNEKGLTDPGLILHNLNDEVNRSLKQNRQDSESRDGMDVAICCYDFTTMEMQYAGANRPLYYVSNGQLEEIKADKFPIGGLEYDVPKKFNTKTFKLNTNDSVYISTDGYADQFSPDDKKLMTRKFKEVILSIQHLPMQEQGMYLGDFYRDWKGNVEQTDDVLVIGVRV